ncbi:caspase family protein [Roseibium marinum]|uniref:Putative caspase-like protein n=1 Tax=Roseibium marinum TaxID=281252 RepID=A0A2S3V3G6_9HYPH|nr:caspase family protein [Roseibium marinum]POF34537.1 putative caspase-like protein [Roseibium marinum]
MDRLVVQRLLSGFSGLACGLLLVAICCGTASAQGELSGVRMALIIGNSNYTSEKLPNARNDAESIATTLRTLDFDVRLVLDATRDRFLGEIEEFAEDTLRRNASVVLVYYAGHGVQLAGKNYFIPVDAHISDVDSLVDQSVQFDELLNLIGKSSSFKMIFLDACQNNPFQGRIDSVGVGLAPPPDVSGFLIGFATQPGKVAFDGAGKNSPYTSALLANMHAPGQEVLSVLAEVNRYVRKDTGGAQVPYVQFSVKPEFYFLPGEKAEQDVEVRLWKLAAQQADPELIDLYMQRYPEGRYAGEARTLLEKAGSNLAGLGTRNPKSRDTLEDEIWTNALASRNGSLLEYYIERFPNGRNLQQAKEIVTQIAPDDEANITPAELCRQFATHPNDATIIYRGVSLDRLAKNSAAATKACESAVRTFPEDPHYKALLARAYAAGGDTDRAIDFYKQAALAGNTRALVSLGLFYELGQGVPKNLATARALFEEAYSHGSTDGAINLAVSLYSGTGGARDVARAITLLEFASSEGAARATFNLGVFAKEGINKSAENAVAYFELAARQGYAEGALAAAAIYDEGFHTDKSPQKASELLLSALTTDNGEILSKVAADADSWSLDTIMAVQLRMKTAGYYDGALDGVPGPRFNRGLELWRLYGGSPS